MKILTIIVVICIICSDIHTSIYQGHPSISFYSISKQLLSAETVCILIFPHNFLSCIRFIFNVNSAVATYGTI